jgi:hypothetical protein
MPKNTPRQPRSERPAPSGDRQESRPAPRTRSQRPPRPVADGGAAAPDLRQPSGPTSPKPAPVFKEWSTWVRAHRGDKQAALKDFWESNRLPDRPPQLIRGTAPEQVPADSTLGVFYHPTQRTLQPRRSSDLEGLYTEAHKELGEKLLEQLKKPHLVRASKSMVALHLRAGNGTHFLIMQVKPESPNTWRELGKLVEWIERTLPEIGGVWFAHEGPAHPFYWGESSGLQMRKSFGPDTLHEGDGENRVFFHPLDRMDVDRTLLPLTGEIILQLLKPKPDSKILCIQTGCGAPVLALSKEASAMEILDGRGIARETYARNRERHQWKHVRFHKFDENKDWDRLSTADLVYCGTPHALVTAQVNAIVGTGAKRVARRYSSPLELEKEWSKWKKLGWMLLRLKVLDPNPARPESMDLWAVFQGEAERRFKDGQSARKIRPEKTAGPVFVQR